MIEQAVKILREGGLVVFPTETVYGLGADATNAAAVERIFAAKGRPSTNPLICHVADATTARQYAKVWPESAQVLAKTFWPGALTLVVPKAASIVSHATAGRDTVGLRAPDHPMALKLLRAFGGALAGPSANKSNRVSPTTAQHVRDGLGKSVALILDGGPCKVGIESTVLDLSVERPTILRHGGISREQIEAVIGPVEVSSPTVGPESAASSPGQQAVHYSPRTPAVRFETRQRGQVSPGDRGMILLSPLVVHKQYGKIVVMPRDPSQYARHLYAEMRRLDRMDLKEIAIEMPPDEPQWAAVRDRITRATRPMEERPIQGRVINSLQEFLEGLDVSQFGIASETPRRIKFDFPRKDGKERRGDMEIE